MMRLRAFVSSSQKWCQGRVFSEVPSTGNSRSSWIWHLETHEQEDPVTAAARGLQALQEGLAASNNICPPHLIILQPQALKSVDDSLLYLREVLPIGAKFLEEHPSIGSFGRTNAHQKPLDTHVAGICQHFPHHSIEELASLLDVYLPTRLALSTANLGTTAAPNEDDWEAVMENTDLILCEKGNDKRVVDLWKNVWASQQMDECQDTFAICSNAEEKMELDRIFHEFTQQKG
ncbi:expressed unknown protein [Seminavis robusta]|uniref:Uncharacterized protein n=1 Tax=Seminavis robusta TaxID=568900 RepID=A0A9N8HCF5_9STRA|nr:expressed unknown protein [Seminavis robusta]|eukprot:Sro300_g111570.1 n/a (233) ;mRNA; f:338-1036